MKVRWTDAQLRQIANRLNYTMVTLLVAGMVFVFVQVIEAFISGRVTAVLQAIQSGGAQ